MSLEIEALVDRPDPQDAIKQAKPEVNPHERNRLIAHLGRTFARRYDIQVLPSRQKGLWATSLDPKTSKEMARYIGGERDTLDDLPPESFVPRQILYDERGAMEMSMDEIITILHHEAGHTKYTDFRSMIEGQRHAKDEGYLSTSFWLTFEGIEDPRVNSLEGEESPAIDRQIRRNQAKDLKERITEKPLSQRPLMLQFAYNSFHYWLHGEGIPELAGTDVGRLGELARPLLQQYFENTDVDERKLLQQHIWDIAKELEKKDIEREEKRHMAQEKQIGKQQSGEDQQQGGPGQPDGSTGASGEQQASSGQGEGEEGAGHQRTTPGGQSSGEEQSAQSSQQKSSGSGRRRFRDRLKDTFFGHRNNESASSEDSVQEISGEKSQTESQDTNEQQKPPAPESKLEKFDLSQLTPDELAEIEGEIERLTPEEKAELTRKAREVIDEMQKEALEEDLSKTMKLEKNNKTGEYEARPQTATEKQKRQAEEDYQEALGQVEAEEKEVADRQEAERRQQEEFRRQLDKERQEKIEMERAGFDPAERDKFLLYQSLEDSIYSHVRNFRQAIEKVIPRKKEPVYESGFFSGPKFDRRELVRRAPLGDEQFHMRQVEKPIGDPRLFIGLLVDNSFSMNGKKMEEARKTVIFFSKVARDMGIPFMAGAFGNTAEVIKEFKQDFDNPSERIKPKLIDATDASGGGTNLHAGLEVTIEAMNEQRRRIPDSHGLVFVITDGGANVSLIGDELAEYVEQNRGRLTFSAFGLSGSDSERNDIQSHLNNYFGESNCAYPDGFDDLPDEAFRMLRVKLMQFQRFMS